MRKAVTFYLLVCILDILYNADYEMNLSKTRELTSWDVVKITMTFCLGGIGGIYTPEGDREKYTEWLNLAISVNVFHIIGLHYVLE